MQGRRECPWFFYGCDRGRGSAPRDRGPGSRRTLPGTSLARLLLRLLLLLELRRLLDHLHRRMVGRCVDLHLAGVVRIGPYVIEPSRRLIALRLRQRPTRSANRARRRELLAHVVQPLIFAIRQVLELGRSGGIVLRGVPYELVARRRQRDPLEHDLDLCCALEVHPSSLVSSFSSPSRVTRYAAAPGRHVTTSAISVPT